MKHLLNLLPWKKCFYLSAGMLPLMMIFSFYGLYTNKFYFLKVDNYIFSFLIMVHLIFLYTLWKVDMDENAYLGPLRNLEFAMYAILLVYLFKLIETLYILLSYLEYSEQVFPLTFLPMGILVLILQTSLIILTLVTFKHRRIRIGSYWFDRINES
jgi:hypothetical protein